MNVLVLVVFVVVLPLLVAALLFLMPLLEKQIHTSCQQVADALTLNYIGSQRTEILRPLTQELQLFADYGTPEIPNVIRGEWDDAVILSFPFSISYRGGDPMRTKLC